MQNQDHTAIGSSSTVTIRELFGSYPILVALFLSSLAVWVLAGIGAAEVLDWIYG